MVRMTKPCLYGILVVFLATAAMALPPRETKLNSITLGSSYADVLAKCGMPHGVGPAVASVEEIWNLLDPPERVSEVAQELQSVAAPGLPNPGAARISLYSGMKTRAYQLRPQHCVWMYVGDSIASNKWRDMPDPRAQWATYVIFNEQGRVVGVVVMTDSAKIQVPKHIRTSSNITIGSTLIDVAQVYTWPDPLIQYEGYFFCSYPDQNVTFTIDVNTRQVTTMAIGLPVTATLVGDKRSTATEILAEEKKKKTNTIPGMPGIPGGFGLPPGAPGMPPPGANR